MLGVVAGSLIDSYAIHESSRSPIDALEGRLFRSVVEEGSRSPTPCHVRSGAIGTFNALAADALRQREHHGRVRVAALGRCNRRSVACPSKKSAAVAAWLALATHGRARRLFAEEGYGRRGTHVVPDSNSVRTEWPMAPLAERETRQTIWNIGITRGLAVWLSVALPFVATGCSDVFSRPGTEVTADGSAGQRQ